MQQQTAGAAFLVCNSLKRMVHPEVGPTQLSEGVKEGYFLVNLSAVQNFHIGPEFFESTFAVNDDLERMDTLSDNGQPTNLADDQEIQDPDVLSSTRHNNRSQMEDAEEEYDSESEAEAAAAEYYRSSRRFSDSSDDDDGFKITEHKKNSNTVTSVDEEIKQTDQVIFDEDGNEIDEDLDRIHRYVEEIEKEIVQQSSNTVSKEHAQSTNKNTATEESSEAASRSDSQSTKPKSRRIIQPVNTDDIYVPHLTNNLESLKSRDKGKARDYGNTSHIQDNVNHLLTSSSADIQCQAKLLQCFKISWNLRNYDPFCKTKCSISYIDR
ncbi:uncharacterized protein EV154DRAFT_569371 [Mucor mucedo]|uniref:uncharacterized protein n=1 Tax=Mucor mucedo TaxID=29922 RepID=UPI0022200571|nr:uncharacterized protein EV154DRAFT_569371 [Mucor mucedo]KAI7875932.1 hypothetical protein EV154DRAFT_569371 [Mucor mucedo]